MAEDNVAPPALPIQCCSRVAFPNLVEHPSSSLSAVKFAFSQVNVFTLFYLYVFFLGGIPDRWSLNMTLSVAFHFRRRQIVSLEEHSTASRGDMRSSFEDCL